MKIRSFTLIEILVAIFLFTLIGLAFITFVRNGYQIYLRTQITSGLNDESHALTSRLTNGLRGTFAVISASSTSVVVQSYFAPTDTTPTQVTITKTGANLSLSTITGVSQANGTFVYDPATATTKTISGHLVNNPTTPLLQYYNESNVLLTAPISISGVHLIEVTVTVFSPIDSTKTATASTRVELRNLKTNL